jgi:hypothetical protein
MTAEPVKNFFRDWGWLMPVIMIPLAMSAADSRYVLGFDMNKVTDRVEHLEVRSAIMGRHTEDAGIHMSFQETAAIFVPRNELTQVFDSMRREQESQGKKLDKLFDLLTK